VGQTNLHLLKNIISFRFPPFRILGTPKPKIFPHFFKFCARRFFFLKEWKFSGFVTQTSSKFAGGKRGGGKTLFKSFL